MTRFIQTAALLFCIVLLSCSQKEKSKEVKLSIKAPAQKLTEVIARTYTSLASFDSKILAKTTSDSSGNCTLTFTLDKPVFVMLVLGDKYNELYISPGATLDISADQNDILHYTGPGSEVNNYIAHTKAIQQEIEKVAEKNLAELSDEEFKRAIATMNNQLITSLDQFADSVKMSDDTRYLMKVRNEALVLSHRQRFQQYYGIIHDYQIPAEFNISDHIPLDSTLFYANSIYYGSLPDMERNIALNTWLHSGDSLEIKYQLQDSGVMARSMRDKILTRKLSASEREFLLAQNSNFWTRRYKLYPPIDSLFFDFKNLYPQSVHLAGLQSFRQKLLALLPGQPAPPIRAATLQGDTVDLSTFKNKVVYIDIWASWCVPCVAEIPHAKKLQAAFKGNDSVVFVNISVGDPYDHWKQALQKYEGWNGLHLRHDGSLYETFQMRGIPVYILIDKNGNLVSADATRPSNPETEKTIRKLL